MPHIQYCLDDIDITGDPYDMQDATEIRVWDDESLVVGLEVNEHGVWLVSTSDGSMFEAGAVVGDRAAALELARAWVNIAGREANVRAGELAR